MTVTRDTQQPTPIVALEGRRAVEGARTPPRKTRRSSETFVAPAVPQALAPRVTPLKARAASRQRSGPMTPITEGHSVLADSPAPIAGIEALPLPWWKRAMDLLLAATLLVLIAPAMAAISIAILLERSGSGVFYRHHRVGRGGRIFTCLKFRSMRPDADIERTNLVQLNEARGQIFKMKDDPRVTSVGRILRKTSMDELPQLINVLRGEMSLVGPRPPLPVEVADYEPRHLARLQGMPGVTGLWQVTARANHDFEEMVALDIAYLAQVTLVGDVRILLRTVRTVVTAEGSY